MKRRLRKIISYFLIFTTIAGASICARGAAEAQTIAYSYDSIGRVIKVVYPNGQTVNYTYDSAGNRTTVTVQSVSIWGSFIWGKNIW
jgi:YD repeat-containing protein